MPIDLGIHNGGLSPYRSFFVFVTPIGSSKLFLKLILARAEVGKRRLTSDSSCSMQTIASLAWIENSSKGCGSSKISPAARSSEGRVNIELPSPFPGKILENLSVLKAEIGLPLEGEGGVAKLSEVRA